MSLNIYLNESEIPKSIRFIRNNDKFFGDTSVENTVIVNAVLQRVEKASYYSDSMFTDRNGGNLYWDCLSTGTKTILNIIDHPDICFDTIECGVNAIATLPLIREGNVLLRFYLFQVREYNKNCDINFRGKNYTNTGEFIEVLKQFI